MNEFIFQALSRNPKAMRSYESVLEHAGIDHVPMKPIDIIKQAQAISLPCLHGYDKPVVIGEVRKCINCGALQTN